MNTSTIRVAGLLTLNAVLSPLAFMALGQETQVDVPSKQEIAANRSPFIHLKNHPEIMKIAPKVPLVEGCYKFTTAWEKTDCVADEENAKYPHLEYLPAISYGKASSAGTTPPMPITGGSVDVSFTKLGSETDTNFGNNYWSIQVNSNGFQGSNGQSDWVQFTDQYVPNSHDHLCIWNVNVTTQSYPSTCLDVTHPREVRTGDYASIEAYEDFDKADGSTHYLLLRAYLSWDSETTMYAVVAKDQNGLTNAVNNVGPWTEVFGSILGYGNGSTANFSATTLTVMVEALDCKWESATGCTPNPGPWTWPATNPFSKLSAGTEEQNNLQPAVGYGPTTKNLPSLNCSMEYACYLTYTATAN
jgi:hypothetical protein